MFCYKRIFLIELVGSLFFLFFHSAEAEPLGFDFFSSPGRVSHYTFLVGLAQVYSKELVIEQTGRPVNHAPKSRAYYPIDQPIIGPVLMIDGEHFASPEKRWGFNWSVMPLYYRVQAGTYRLVDENDVLYVQSPASDLFLFFVGAGPVVHYPMNRGSVYAGAQLMGTLGWQTNTNNGEGDAYGRGGTGGLRGGGYQLKVGFSYTLAAGRGLRFEYRYMRVTHIQGSEFRSFIDGFDLVDALDLSVLQGGYSF